MRRKRKHIPLAERLAAALAMLLPQEQRDELRERKVSAKAVIALFEQDHNILHSAGGPDVWWNITPMLKAPHREKSQQDTKIAAKSKRIIADPDKWRDFLRPKTKKRERRSRWQSRPFPKKKTPSLPGRRQV